MSFRFMLKVGEWVKSPRVQLAVAIILIIASVGEIIESFDEDLERWRLGIHHGMLILGLANGLASIPDLVEGFERIEETKKKASGHGGEKGGE